MSQSLLFEKHAQALELVRRAGVDLWLTFVRETSESSDPVLPFLMEGGLTWQSALIFTGSGKQVAIVGNYDADPLVASGLWDEVVTYVQGIKSPLIETLEKLLAGVANPKIAVNFSVNDDKADGLSHGMYLLLEGYLKGTRFEGTMVSAEEIVLGLRCIKSAAEVALIREAISETDILFDLIGKKAAIGVTEMEVFEYVQAEIESRGFGYAWDKDGDPIVNSGPDSMVGHGRPSSTITIAPGHIFHIDLGIRKDDYSSDIQRCWYVPHPGETSLPEDVVRATNAVVGAIQAGYKALKPGIEGWMVDRAAREFLVSAGYEEYQHALGHQVGRMAHDGGALLGPRWERYGRTPFIPIEKGMVFTIELGVLVEGRGYISLEEIAVVTDSGCEWLTTPQVELPLLGN
ncbi:MAG: Xaa-Pro peptidase family protein [Chthonomonadales bacterium]